MVAVNPRTGSKTGRGLSPRPQPERRCGAQNAD